MNKSLYLHPAPKLIKEELEHQSPPDWELILSQLVRLEAPTISNSHTKSKVVNRITRRMFSGDI
jgi:hypothetical protein